MAEITVREAAGAEDVAAVRRLMQAYGKYLADHPAGAANICLEGYGQELAELPGKYAVLLMAEVDGEPAGCVALRRMKREPACEMKRLWVEGRFRGLGLGRRLVKEAIDWAERMELEAMYLDTVPAAMPEANQLYEAMGFVRVEQYNRNPVENLVYFRRALGAGLPRS